MSQPFNPRVVVEKTPNALLKRFLSEFPRFSGLNWKSLAETDVEPILQRVRASADHVRRFIWVRFQQAHALADSHGTAALIAAGRDCNLEIANDLATKKNAYERAFWCLVEHPVLFDSERIYAYTYSFPKTSRETRIGFPERKLVATDEMIAALKQTIRDTFHGEQRAEKCEVDHREHDGVHLFHASPSDYVDEIDSYGSDGRLGSLRVWPPFHIAYYVDETAGSVTVLSKGGSNKIEELFSGFGRAIYGIPTPPPKAAKNTYDLSLFKNPSHEFVTDPAHHLSPPRVVRMHLQFPESRYHTAWYEVDPNDRHDNIYHLLKKKLRGGFEELARTTILTVELQVVFNVPGEREEVVNFRTTFPRWCTLGHYEKDGILRRYLRPWGIESDGKRVAAASKPTRLG